MNKNDLEFLINLQHELNTQENDGNADPLFWGIMEEKKVPAYPGCGDGTDLVINSETVYSNNEIEELKEWMEEVNLFNEEEIECIEDLDDANSILSSKGVDCELYPYNIEHVLSQETGAFLTKQACLLHIKVNGHNLKKPHTYAMTAYRNFELERLLKILKETNWEAMEVIE